ncbi:hypothetical protein [Jeongeupia chitinilytica]|uniref:DUF2721 domain-containing protein n=1 Tax=Jeongeupia chitinilytica TaxID=1041641 RepID=A0ABQ3H2A2_9NEIS|nr:hypothetical protein [Jeongeupia chitinilytica]GHD63839.1 hypothetical protein GCM10007350_22090 [Jeongeupia chitinilytica]
MASSEIINIVTIGVTLVTAIGFVAKGVVVVRQAIQKLKGGEVRRLESQIERLNRLHDQPTALIRYLAEMGCYFIFSLILFASLCFAANDVLHSGTPYRAEGAAMVFAEALLVFTIVMGIPARVLLTMGKLNNLEDSIKGIQKQIRYVEAKHDRDGYASN